MPQILNITEDKHRPCRFGRLKVTDGVATLSDNSSIDSIDMHRCHLVLKPFLAVTDQRQRKLLPLVTLLSLNTKVNEHSVVFFT